MSNNIYISYGFTEKIPLMFRLKRSEETETKAENPYCHETPAELLADFETGDNENLIDFFLSRLTETSSFRQIRIVAKIAIANGMAKNDNAKKDWVLSALKKLESLEISIKMQTIILAAIEVVVLSRRISNLKKLGVFARKVAENNNHCWLLKGAQLAISTFYPKLNIHYLRCPNLYKIDKDEIRNIKKNLTRNGILWLVVSYQDSLHLTLVRVQFANEKLTVHVFDSVAAMPKDSGKAFDSELYNLVDSIKEEVKPKKESIKYVSTLRQIDSTNCFSFVLLDLNAALNSSDKKFFLNKKASEDKEYKWLYKNVREYTAFAPAFYKSAQARETLSAEIVNTWKLLIISTKSTCGNPEALWTSARTLTSLIKNEKIHFTSPHFQEDGESEEDIQIICDSTL